MVGVAKFGIAECYRAFAADRAVTAALTFAGVTWASWLIWIKSAGSLAGDVLPIAAVALALAKIYTTLYPREPKPASAAAAVAPGWHWSWKGIGLAALAVLTLGGILLFSRSASASPGDASGGEATDETGGEEPTGHALYDLARTFQGNTPEALKNGRANPKVKAMFAAVKGGEPGGRFDPEKVDCRKVPWCSVFINYLCMRLNYPRTNSPMARSWLLWGQRALKPMLGDVVVMWRGKYDDGESGHVGLFVKKVGPWIYVLAGNQGDCVSVEKFHESKLLQYRRKMPLWKSKQVIANAATAAGAAGGGGAIVHDIATSGEPAVTPVLVPAAETIETAKETLQQVAWHLPGRWQQYALLACTVLSLAGAYYVWHERKRYRSEIGW